MPSLLGVRRGRGTLSFTYVCMSVFTSVYSTFSLLLNNLSSLANHLKFIHKVRFYKWKAKFNFGLDHLSNFCSEVMPLNLLKNAFFCVYLLNNLGSHEANRLKFIHKVKDW